MSNKEDAELFRYALEVAKANGFESLTDAIAVAARKRATESAARASLRDTFAAAALTGLLAGGLKNPAMHGRLVYEIADAMLAAREGK